MFTLLWFISGIWVEYIRPPKNWDSESSTGHALCVIPAMMLDAISIGIYQCACN